MAPNSFITQSRISQRSDADSNALKSFSQTWIEWTAIVSERHGSVIKSFSQSWSEWTLEVSKQKPQLPEPPTDALKLQQYIINNHGWWPIFGGEPKLKRKHGASTSLQVSPKKTPNRLIHYELPKRRKIHNNSHFSSQFSCKNYLAVEWIPEEDFFLTANPPRTTTSALPQENFAAVTSRVLLVRRLKAKQGNAFKGDAATRFRKSVLTKEHNATKNWAIRSIVETSNVNHSIDADVIVKRPWKDGTTHPIEGTLDDLKRLRIQRAGDLGLLARSIFEKTRADRELLEKAREYYRIHKGKCRPMFARRVVPPTTPRPLTPKIGIFGANPSNFNTNQGLISELNQAIIIPSEDHGGVDINK
ncbi:383_t:CDS:2 [Funneliformis caledonium]|uniref:383_t:CDS:1 n=1 Tax=Funneliformis caledonium TaxID=1117310 RepID=A0A9N9FC40_9GLOM|nr:383_t:CDS:2 [Funneliformis caledonium]